VRSKTEIRDEALHWIGFTGLAARKRLLPAGLNLHERKFLELARALAARPKLLLLDEVLSGLNPTEIDNAIRLVRAIRAQGATIVFVEHLMRPVVELSDRVAVLNEGKLFALGAPREVMAIRRRQHLSGQGLCCLRRANLQIGYGDATACVGRLASTSARARSCR
jgi:branched-chain amino acid transport system permease protein